MVPLGHRNKGTASRGNSGIRGETGSSTRTQKGPDEGGRRRHLSEPILRVDATCRRCIVLVRRSVQLELAIKLPLTRRQSLNGGERVPLAIMNLDHKGNVQRVLGSLLVNGRPECRGDHAIRRHSGMKTRAHYPGAGRGEGLGGALWSENGCKNPKRQCGRRGNQQKQQPGNHSHEQPISRNKPFREG